MPDTKDSREKKGRVKEQQRLESDIEQALDVDDEPPEPPLEDEDEELELGFEE